MSHPGPGLDPDWQFRLAAFAGLRRAKVRLHQRRFRELVVLGVRWIAPCAGRRHGELLDAAHILADRDERGRPQFRRRARYLDRERNVLVMPVGRRATIFTEDVFPPRARRPAELTAPSAPSRLNVSYPPSSFGG